jgi:hypothetical protein
MAACQAQVSVIARRGAYDRASPAVAGRPCRACAWRLAIETGSTGRELALIIPSRATAGALARSGADPMLAVRVCEAVLRSAHRGGDDDEGIGGLGSPAVIQVLELATRHRPVLYLGEACAEGDCEKGSAGERGYSCATAGCGACTPHAGSWAGDWEGTALPGLLVPTPCSVLTVLAARFCIPAH